MKRLTPKSITKSEFDTCIRENTRDSWRWQWLPRYASACVVLTRFATTLVLFMKIHAVTDVSLQDPDRAWICRSRSGPGSRQLGSVGFTLRSGALRSDPRWSFRVAKISGVMCSRPQNDGRVAMDRRVVEATDSDGPSWQHPGNNQRRNQ